MLEPASPVKASAEDPACSIAAVSALAAPLPVVVRLFRSGHVQSMVNLDGITPCWGAMNDRFGRVVRTLGAWDRHEADGHGVDCTWVLLESVDMALNSFEPDVGQNQAAGSPSATTRRYPPLSDTHVVMPRLMFDPLLGDLLYVVHSRGVYMLKLDWLANLADALGTAATLTPLPDADLAAASNFTARSFVRTIVYSRSHDIVGAQVSTDPRLGHELVVFQVQYLPRRRICCQRHMLMPPLSFCLPVLLLLLLLHRSLLWP